LQRFSDLCGSRRLVPMWWDAAVLGGKSGLLPNPAMTWPLPPSEPDGQTRRR
jgi:hypothetical protein